MRAEGNDFNLHLGDTMYSDSEIPGRLEPVALTVPAGWMVTSTGTLRRLARFAPAVCLLVLLAADWLRGQPIRVVGWNRGEGPAVGVPGTVATCSARTSRIRDG